MHVISRKKLREFMRAHPDAKMPLDVWYRLAKAHDWDSFSEVTRLFGRRVDRVGKFFLFNIGGNKYRLVAFIHFNRHKLFIRHVFTHAEYDEDDWKDE
jgi:mRNA interferase HigB